MEERESPKMGEDDSISFRVNSLYAIEKYNSSPMCHRNLAHPFYAIIYNFSSPISHYR